MSSINNDYQSLMNQQRLNNSNALFGNSGSSIAGISGDMLQQWAMLGANSSAYKKLLEAEKTGSIKQNSNYTELASDKYFNENYDPETKKLKKATYTPVGSTGPAISSDATSGDVLNDMRTLALSAISNPSSLTSTHYDFFEKMRQNIASNLVTKGSGNSGTEVTTGEATQGTASKTVDYRLLLDDQSFTLAGNKGEKTYNFGVGTSLDDIVAAVNADSAATGVSAAVAEKDGKYEVTFSSLESGKDQFVRLDQLRGDLFASAGSSIKGAGTDATKGKAETVATGDDTQAALAAPIFYGRAMEDLDFTIQGANGAKTISIAKGTSAEDIVTAINDATASTGVTAELIRDSNGNVEGIGLLAEKAGAGNFVEVTQNKGSLFANAGKTVSVAGSSASKSATDGPAINNINDLGKVTLNGQAYSFADLVQGGKGSLANSPDAALAILDQAMKDIYSGRAEVKGFDPSKSDVYVPGVTNVKEPGSSSTSNTYLFNDSGAQSLHNWLGKYGTA